MLDTLFYLVEVSIGCGAVIILLLLLTPVLSRWFSPMWRRWAWFLVALRMFTAQIELFPALIELPVPEVLAETDYRGLEGYRRDASFSRYTEVSSGGSSSSQWHVFWKDDAIITRYNVTGHLDSGGEWNIRDNYWFRTETDLDGKVTRTVHYPTIIFAVWAGIAAVCFSLVVSKYRKFRERALLFSRPAPQEEQDMLEHLKERFGVKRQVELRRCSIVRAPMLMGVRKYVILLPDDLKGNGLEIALCHELIHQKHADPLLLLICTFARSLHWFNPLAWVMVRHIRQTIEECCDYELLLQQDIESRRTYGQAILKQMSAQQGIPSITTGFLGDRKSLFVRFHAIMDATPKRQGSELLLAAALLLALTGGLVSCDGEVPISEFENYSGEIRVILTEPLEADDTVLYFDPFENQKTLRNTDVSLQSLPISATVNVENLDYYQILHDFDHARFGDQNPAYYTLVLEEGTVEATIPGNWFDIPEADISTLPYFPPLEWSEEFFEAFSDADYERMKVFCTEDCRGFYFDENAAFWFVTARAISGEVLPEQSQDGVKVMEFLVDGQPASGSALERLDGPYVMWFTCLRQEDGSWMIDSCTTGSMLGASYAK